MENTYTKKVYSALILLLIFLAFLLGCFTFYFYDKSLSEKPLSAVPVTNSLVLNAEPVNAQDIEFVNEYIGHIYPINEAHIKPYISGYIDKILVNGGQYVKKGDVLLVLEQAEYKASLDAAYANIIKAKANLNNAEVYFNRTQKAKTSVSQTELDKAKADFLSAQASFEEATANFELAKVNFNYTVLTSPINGISGDVALTKGNYVSPSTDVLFSIVQLSPIRVRFSITDKEYLEKRTQKTMFEGEEILLKLSDGQIFPNKGTFKYTDNVIDKISNSIGIYADFENIGNTLIPNAYVTVLVRKVFSGVVKISKQNAILETDGVYVYIIRNEKIEKEKLNILADDNSFFIAQNTLSDADFLITQNINPQDIGKNATPKNKDNK